MAGGRRCWHVGCRRHTSRARARRFSGFRSMRMSIRGRGRRITWMSSWRTGAAPRKGWPLSTLRANSGAIRAFCYLTDGRYGWAAFCERVFADIPCKSCSSGIAGLAKDIRQTVHHLSAPAGRTASPAASWSRCTLHRESGGKEPEVPASGTAGHPGALLFLVPVTFIGSPRVGDLVAGSGMTFLPCL